MDLKITLIKDVAHCPPEQKKIVRALGFGRVNNTAVLPNNAATRGALLRTAHPIPVEEVNK